MLFRSPLLGLSDQLASQQQVANLTELQNLDNLCHTPVAIVPSYMLSIDGSCYVLQSLFAPGQACRSQMRRASRHSRYRLSRQHHAHVQIASRVQVGHPDKQPVQPLREAPRNWTLLLLHSKVCSPIGLPQHSQCYRALQQFGRQLQVHLAELAISLRHYAVLDTLFGATFLC